MIQARLNEASVTAGKISVERNRWRIPGGKKTTTKRKTEILNIPKRKSSFIILHWTDLNVGAELRRHHNYKSTRLQSDEIQEGTTVATEEKGGREQCEINK